MGAVVREFVKFILLQSILVVGSPDKHIWARSNIRAINCSPLWSTRAGTAFVSMFLHQLTSDYLDMLLIMSIHDGTTFSRIATPTDNHNQMELALNWQSIEEDNTQFHLIYGMVIRCIEGFQDHSIMSFSSIFPVKVNKFHHQHSIIDITYHNIDKSSIYLIIWFPLKSNHWINFVHLSKLSYICS